MPALDLDLTDFTQARHSATDESSEAVRAELERRRVEAAQQQALKNQADANTRQNAQETRAAALAPHELAQQTAQGDEAQRKAQLPLMASDALQWQLHDPRYQTEFNAAPPEAKRHMIDAYGTNAAEAPQIWNQAARQTTGDPTIGTPKAPEGMLETQTIGPNGELTRHFNKPAPQQFDPFTTPQQIEEKMDPNELAIARQIANHDLPLTFMSRMSQDAKMRIQSAVPVLNPSWKGSDYPIQQSARREFTTGSAAKNITSINTAINHLDGLDKSAKKLGNSSFKPANAVGNFLKDQTGDADVSSFHTNAESVASELAKVYKGGVATQGEVDEQRKSFSPNLAPAQIRANIIKSVELMAGRIESLRNQYESAYGKPRETPILDEKSQVILRGFGFDPSSIDPAIKPAPDVAPLVRHGQPATQPAAPTATQAKPVKSPEDQAAIAWANAHPKDPRAARILALHPAQ